MTNKFVRFPENKRELERVYNCVVWDYAYRNARRGQWCTMAIDRMRFKHRIQTVEKQISYIFESTHRSIICENRFKKLC